MIEVEYSAQSELRRPARFLGAAIADLRAAGLPAWRLFQRNLRIRHRRALLGYLWLIMPAVVTAVICTFIRAHRIVAVGPTSLPYPLFVLTGMIYWQIFVDSLTAPLQQLSAARGLLGRNRLPHEAILLAGMLDVGLGVAARLAVMFAALVLFGTALSQSAVLVLVAAAALMLLGFAIGLVLAPAGLFYDDVPRGLSLATTFGLFVTPVLYPIRQTGLLALNPVAPLIEAGRGWLTGAATPVGEFLVVTGGALVLLMAAWLIYRAARPYIIERLG